MKKSNYNLKIERENGSFDEVSFSFRITEISEEIIDDIKFLLKNEDVIINKPKLRNFYVVLFEDIGQDFNIELIKKIIENYKLSQKQYGFWISINSEYGHGGGYIPSEILAFYRIIGGQIDFSYIIMTE